MSDPEIHLVSKALAGCFGEIVLLGVTEDHFSRYKYVWKWLSDFESKYKKTPDVATFKEAFPEVGLLVSNEPVEHYIDMLQWSLERKEYVNYVDKLNVILKKRDRLGARELTTDLYRKVAYDVSEDKDIVGSLNIHDSYKFIRGIESNFTTLVPTGFSVADSEIGGWGNGEFIAYLAPPYSGKSWLLLNSAVSAVKSGRKVMVLSGEMPDDKVWLRFLCLYFGLPAKRAQQGRLTDVEKRKLRKGAKENLPGDIVIINGYNLTGTDLLRRKVLQYSPDLLLVDSWYSLINDNRGRARWEELSSLASEFKKMAMDLNIPVIVTHQMGRAGAERAKGARLSDVSGSFDLIGWLDVAIVAVLNDDLRKSKELGLIFRKARYFDPFSFTVKFNVNDGEEMVSSRDTWMLEDSGRPKSGISDEELDYLTKSAYG